MKNIVIGVTLLASMSSIASDLTSETFNAGSFSKCVVVAKESAKKALQNEDTASGLNEDIAVKFVPLNNGGIYIVAGWIRKIFDWEVIVVVNRNCDIQSSTINNL